MVLYWDFDAIQISYLHLLKLKASVSHVSDLLIAIMHTPSVSAYQNYFLF